MNKRITISDIAREAGVTKSTVSFVLNDHAGRVPISAATRARVMKIVEAHNYQPNPMARSLTTRRTGSLGFFLSDDMEGGFANMFFANFLNGAEAECRRRGYGLSVGLFNLTCIDSFIFPTPVRQRCIDGVILAGFVADEVLDKFAENNVNCVSIGDYMAHPERICTVSFDTIGGTLTALKHLVGLGHRRIALPHPVTPRDLLEIERVKRRISACPELYECEPLFLMTPGHSGDYGAAEQILRSYFAIAEAERPTAILCSDQTALALLSMLHEAGLECPRNLSIIASSDTALCRFASPRLTSVRYDLTGMGEYAARLLIENIEKGTQLTALQSKNDFQGELQAGCSTGKVLL